MMNLRRSPLLMIVGAKPAPASLRLFMLLANVFAALAAFSAGQAPVPIEKEPMHRLKLENEFVRVFDVLIPAGTASLFHTHVFDGVGIRVSDADMSEEFSDGSKKSFTAVWGEASFGSGPEFSHRVINPGRNDFRNIYIELLPRKGSAKSRELPPLSDGHIVLIDNPRVRVNRLALQPGESSKPHAHALNGLGIIIHDSRIEISVPGVSPLVMEPRAGDFAWQTAGTAHTLKNIGSTVFEVIDVEVK
jgi:quercetin dioxygenase-like cupin family protein